MRSRSASSARCALTTRETSFWTPMIWMQRPSSSRTGASRSSLKNGRPSLR